MNHKEILKRAWSILWSYKTLWVFGIILGLTTASGGQRTFNYTSDKTGRASQPSPEFLGKSFQEGMDEAGRQFEKMFTEAIPPEWVDTVIAIAIALGCLVLMLIVASTIFRYISRTALIEMVNNYEDSDAKNTVREGFKLGWSPKGWRLFLMDLLIWLPVIAFFVVLFLVIFAPLLFWATNNMAAGILGTVMSIGLFVLGIFLAIVVSTLLTLLLEFFRRAVVLENLGISEAMQLGLSLAKDNLAGVGLMWLIVLGINIGFTIVTIPAMILVLLTAGVISGVIGLIAAGTVGLLLSPLGVGVGVGVPIFLILIAIPAIFVEGLRQTYLSTTWTLTFRELSFLEKISQANGEAAPVIEAGEADL